MKPSFRSRMKRLEARAKFSEPLKLLYGWLTHLPEDFVGERHTVIVQGEPAGSPHAEWRHFEERPGPAPPGSDEGGLTIYLTR
jgi:hypothetical protein